MLLVSTGTGGALDGSSRRKFGDLCPYTFYSLTKPTAVEQVHSHLIRIARTFGHLHLHPPTRALPCLRTLYGTRGGCREFSPISALTAPSELAHTAWASSDRSSARSRSVCSPVERCHCAMASVSPATTCVGMGQGSRVKVRVWKAATSQADPHKVAARLVLETPAGWVSSSSRGLCGGDALLLSTSAAGNAL